MDKMRTLFGGLIAIAAAIQICAAQEPAQRPRPNRPGDRPGREGQPQEGLLLNLLGDGAAIRELGLSDEQVKDLHAKAFELRQAVIKVRAALDLAGMEQAKLLTQDPVDESAVMSAVEKTGQIRTELAKLQMRQILFFRTAFTPEQRARIHQIFAARRERSQRNDGHSGERDGGRGRRERGANDGVSNRSQERAEAPVPPDDVAQPRP